MDLAAINPADVTRYLGGEAALLLDRYFNSGQFTGGRFERFAGGGDRPHVANRVTSDDIVAVSLLGVRIPGSVSLTLLEMRADEFNALLRQIPVDVDLWEAPESVIGLGAPAARLWAEVVGLPGMGWVTTGKLLARKRPRLIPVYDHIIKNAFGRPDNDHWWQPLRTVLSQNPGIITDLALLRTEVGLGPEVSLLRILDVCVWMREHGQPEPVPDAHT